MNDTLFQFLPIIFLLTDPLNFNSKEFAIVF